MRLGRDVQLVAVGRVADLQTPIIEAHAQVGGGAAGDDGVLDGDVGIAGGEDGHQLVQGRQLAGAGPPVEEDQLVVLLGGRTLASRRHHRRQRQPSPHDHPPHDS